MTMNTSLQNQLLENTVLANQATELQQQLELKDQTISYLLIYRQNLEDDFVTIHEKLDLLDQEVKTIFPFLSALVLQILWRFLRPFYLLPNVLFFQMDQMVHERNLVCLRRFLTFKTFLKQPGFQKVGERWHEAFLPSPQILHYVVTMQACLYDDVEQWLHQLLEDGRITETSVLKFKSMQEQVSARSLLTNDSWQILLSGARNAVVFNNKR